MCVYVCVCVNVIAVLVIGTYVGNIIFYIADI